MCKFLYFIVLYFIVISCSAQNTNVQPQIKNTVDVEKRVNSFDSSDKSSIIKLNGVEFYKQNIGDTRKNDNTISHGSIVTASPKGYHISKVYFPSVAQNFRQRYLILHYTALNDEKSITVLTKQSVSSHYLINNLPDNEIYQLVDENKRAYHSGISYWRNDKNLNDTSIGIEIVNMGYTLNSEGKKIFYPFDEMQIKKLAALAKDIVDRYQIPPTNVLAHSDVAPTRKQDPGPLFPWKKFYEEYRIGMWYDEDVKENFIKQINPEQFVAEQNSNAFILKVQTMLNQFGYDITPTGVWNNSNSKIVEAFQYHFRPENYDGKVDMETWAILQALLKKYPSK